MNIINNKIIVSKELLKSIYNITEIYLDRTEKYIEYACLFSNKEDIIGVEVKELIDTAYKKAQELILEHMDKLHAVAQKLLEKETITAEEFQKIFNR